MTKRGEKLVVMIIMVGAIGCGPIPNVQAQAVQDLSFQEHKLLNDLGTVGAVFPII